jgi:Flp pilus assembly CpaE family ATPase
MISFKVILIGERQGSLDDVRRLLKNQSIPIDTELPDVTAALAGPTPVPGDTRLVFVPITPSRGLDELRQLSALYGAQPVVAVLPAEATRDDVLAAIRAGAAQVLVRPLNTDDFLSAFDGIALQFDRRSGISHVIAVSGVTEGSGATSLAIGLAYEFASQLHKECILIGLARRFGKVGSYLNIKPQYTTEDIVAAGDRLDVHILSKALTPYCDKLRILPAPGERFAPLEMLTPWPCACSS